MSRKENIQRWIMLLVVPAIAIAVAARQIYLSKTSELSTWKGGGMGMFAAADNSYGRFIKIYILAPTGQRMPLFRVPYWIQQLQKTVVWHPSERNMHALAAAIKKTAWVASREEVRLNIFDKEGQLVKTDDSVRFHDIRPASPRAKLDTAGFGVELEFWKVKYNESTSDLRAVLSRKFTLKD